MNEVEQQVIEGQPEVAPTAVFLPGELFYSERIELPVGISAQEKENAIETHLEAHAPFSLDQLNFGAVLDHSGNQALVYALFRDSLKDLEDLEISDVEARFPCFLPFLHFQAEKPCILTGVTEKQLSLLIFDKEGALPSEIHSISIQSEEVTVSHIEKLRADLLRDLPWIQLPIHPEIYTWQSVEQNWKNEKTFLSSTDSGGELRISMQAVEASLADVRDRDLKENALKAARWNQMLWLTTLVSALGLFVVALLAVGNWIWLIGIQSKIELVEQRQTKVEEIEAKDRNLQVFESGSAAQLQPLAMLDIVNRVRPDGVYFGEVRAFEGNQLQVDGMAELNGTSLINQFRDELNKLNQLESVSVEITRINQGVAYFFRANLQFKELELANVGAH